MIRCDCCCCRYQCLGASPPSAASCAFCRSLARSHDRRLWSACGFAQQLLARTGTGTTGRAWAHSRRIIIRKPRSGSPCETIRGCCPRRPRLCLSCTGDAAGQVYTVEGAACKCAAARSLLTHVHICGAPVLYSSDCILLTSARTLRGRCTARRGCMQVGGGT